MVATQRLRRLVAVEPHDAALLDAVARGAPGSRDALARRALPIADAVVFHLLGPDAEHDDLVQDVLISVLKATRLPPAPALVAWVRSVSANTVRTELRKRTVRRLFRRAPPTPRDFSFVEAADARLELSRLFAALDTLPTDERLTATLRLVEGLTIPEIADALSMSESTVKRRLGAAQGRLAELGLRFEETP